MLAENAISHNPFYLSCMTTWTPLNLFQNFKNWPCPSAIKWCKNADDRRICDDITQTQRSNVRLKIAISTNISLYIGNDTRQAHSCDGMRITKRTQALGDLWMSFQYCYAVTCTSCVQLTRGLLAIAKFLVFILHFRLNFLYFVTTET